MPVHSGACTTILHSFHCLYDCLHSAISEMPKVEEGVNTILARPEEERPPARKRTKKASKHASRGERTRKQRVRKRKKDTRARDKKRGGKKRSRKKKRAKKNPT